ncbi:nitrogenase component 1 [uncultured Desulfobacter sp.]|uniref:nitrogenase component 1 n=1 Tax=uncultured Desulfobacter sp. TaxID=240139 RepID=UPI002AAB72E3|nr:nitrogenase component 1 [uncultured Desulfobacter sp.]
MKTAYACKLFGAQQAFTGISDCVTLLHSVVGCNFGSLALHAPCDMSQIRQTTTAISDEDVVFSGEDSLEKSMRYVDELYHPVLIAVVTGCVSDIIQDDVTAIISRFRGNAKIFHQEATGYCGVFEDGYEESLLRLIDFMREPDGADRQIPKINFIGFGADDPHIAADARVLKEFLGTEADLGCILSRCTFEQIEAAAQVSLNIVLGRGKRLAQEMEKRFGIPYQVIDYPYGLSGAEEIWGCLQSHLGIDTHRQRDAFIRRTADGLAPIYSFLQTLYGIPVSVIGTGARYRGMVRFLSEEIGLEVVCGRAREEVSDIDDFMDEVRASETAILFGSSFEQELSDKMNIPLFHFDYPVFRRICITNRPYIGAEGTLHLTETLFNELMSYPGKKGAFLSRS